MHSPRFLRHANYGWIREARIEKEKQIGIRSAIRTIDARLNVPVKVGLPWPSLLAFIRIATNPRVFPRPLDVAAAWRRVRVWLDLETVWTPEPTPHHRDLIDGFLTGIASSSKLVPDAHLAAIAIGHGLTLCSTDGDFARFANLRWENPLVR